jgi:hypothetical protein
MGGGAGSWFSHQSGSMTAVIQQSHVSRGGLARYIEHLVISFACIEWLAAGDRRQTPPNATGSSTAVVQVVEEKRSVAAAAIAGPQRRTRLNYTPPGSGVPRNQNLLRREIVRVGLLFL